MKWPFMSTVLICACVSLSSSAPFVRHDFAMLYPMDPYIQYDYFSFGFGKIFQKAASSVKHAYSYVNNWFFGKSKAVKKEQDHQVNIQPQVSVKAYKIYRDANGNLLVKKLPKIGEVNNQDSNNYDPSFMEPVFLDENNLNENNLQQKNIGRKKGSQKKDLSALPHPTQNKEALDSKITKNPFHWNEKMENDKFFSKAFQKYIIHPVILIRHPKDENVKKQEHLSITTLNEKRDESTSKHIESTTTDELVSRTKASNDDVQSQSTQNSNQQTNDDGIQTQKALDNTEQDPVTPQSENDEFQQSEKSDIYRDPDNVKQEPITEESDKEQRQHSSETRNSEVNSSSDGPQSSELREPLMSSESTQECITQSRSAEDSTDDSKSSGEPNETIDNEENKASSESQDRKSSISSSESLQATKEEHENIDNNQPNEEKSLIVQTTIAKINDDSLHDDINESSDPAFVHKDEDKKDEDDIIQKVLSIVQPS